MLMPGRAPQVERPGDAAGVSRLHVRLHDVADVDEVAGLIAVAEDRDPFASQHLEDEDRDGVTVGVEPLVRSVDVEYRRATASRS